MTRRPNPPTVRLRRLATELLRLRKAAGLTQAQVAEKTAVNAVTLYRLETGRARPQRRTLRVLLDLYGVTEPQRSELVETAQGAEYPGWLRQYQSELPEVYTAYISFEAEARSAREYEPLLIPGLLQTEEYSRAVVKCGMIMARQQEVELRVQVRMQRQALLAKEEPLRLWAVMDEAAIRRQVGGPDVMRQQLWHLVEMTEHSHVTLQVLPLESGAHPAMAAGFIALDFPNSADPELVYVDYMGGDLLLEGDVQIRRYRLIFDHLQALDDLFQGVRAVNRSEGVHDRRC